MDGHGRRQRRARRAVIGAGLAAVALAAVAAPGVFGAQETRTYIVQTALDPVVAYDGGVAGLQATKPVRGRRLDRGAPAVVRYATHLKARHDAMLATVGGRKLYDYVYTYDGFAARLTKDQAKELEARADVIAVTPDRKREIDTSYTPTFLGLDGRSGLWDRLGGPEGRGKKDGAGEDVVIGVIDTGIWPDSLSFTDRRLHKGKPGKVDYDRPPAGWQGTCVTGEQLPASACNRKLIGARHFNAAWGGDAAIDESLPWEFTSARDYNGHGTHTASTAGGNHGVRTSGLARALGEAISGVAPRARIAAYKALWSSEDGAAAGGWDADIVAAIDQAVADGVDVINFSVSGTTINFIDPVEVAFLFAADAGIFVAASAGNNGPTPGTVAHPSPWVTTVAAGTHSRDGRGSVRLGNGTTYRGASLASAAVGPAPLIDGSAAALPGADGAAAALCFAAIDNGGAPVLDPAKVRGKIVICDRGASPRPNKSLAVKNAGGVGVILVNPEPNSLNADLHSLPTVHIADTDREAVKQYAATPGATATIARASLVFSAPAPQIATFSSRGPLQAGAGDILKPDLTAPGQDILAAVAPPGNQGTSFSVYSGTSMSAPHVAGLAALLADLHPSWSPMAVKSALMTSATDLVGASPTDPASIFTQGAGHVRPNGAADPGLVYDAGTEDWLAFLCGSTNGVEPTTCDRLAEDGRSFDPSDYNQASIGIRQLSTSKTVTRRVTNVGSRTATYRASVAGLSGIDVAIEPRTLTLRPGQTRTFTVTFTRTTAPFDTHIGGQLTWSDGTHRVRAPIVLRAGEALWEARYNGRASGPDLGTDIAMDPGGRRVYVTGSSYQAAPGILTGDYATLAYDPATGRRLWEATYAGSGNGSDEPADLALAPDGGRLFVTGLSYGEGTDNDLGTVAYDPATGRQLWAARYDGPEHASDFAGALAVSPDGATVYVTGMIYEQATAGDFVTIAYDAATGAERWHAVYDSGVEATDDPRAIAVSPDGAKVFVTGQSARQGTGLADWGTVAYDAATGEQLWVRHRNGTANDTDIPTALTVSADGSTLYVSGSVGNTGVEADWAVVAYATGSGDERWSAGYDGPAHTTDTPRALTLAPSGDTLFVTGNSDGEGTGTDWTTIAFAAATGDRGWVARHDGPASGFDVAWDLAMTPEGDRVVVTGQSFRVPPDIWHAGDDYRTAMYDAASGEELWSARYNGADGGDAAAAVAVGPLSPELGMGVFVTGTSAGGGTQEDYATVAYRPLR